MEKQKAKAGTFQHGSSSGLENDSQWAEERGHWPKLNAEGITFLSFESFDSRTGFSLYKHNSLWFLFFPHHVPTTQ